MKLLSKGQTERLVFSKRGHAVGRNKFVVMSSNLEIGESILVTCEEWHQEYKNNPAASTFNKLGKKFTVRKLADKTGWAIIRME